MPALQKLPTPEEPARIRPAEVARLLGCSIRTVYNLSKQGRLPFTQLPSGHRRYLRADVEALAAASSSTVGEA